jgi:D-glycero-D-manno-heptose 1,7-bisphosphate phosphatase
MDDFGVSAGGRGLRPAVFFDRDGTMIEHVHYLSDPGLVRLLPGTAEALARLRESGFACVVVTNQSGIGRGMYTEADLGRVHDELDRQLAAAGAVVDAYFHCPEPPRGDDPTVVEHEDRKPGPGMLTRAARELGLNLETSWMVGDMISDVLAGLNAGCRGSILVRTGKPAPAAGAYPGVDYHVADDLTGAVEWILAASREGG